MPPGVPSSGQMIGRANHPGGMNRVFPRNPISIKGKSMKRVNAIRQGGNRAKEAGVRQAMLLAGLVMASAGAQASVTITSGSGGLVNFRDAGSISIRNRVGREFQKPLVFLESRRPYDAIQPAPVQPPAAALNAPSASSSVNGSMSYYAGTSSGYFNESDSSPDGSMVALDMNRKGYGYQAEAASQTGQAEARAETKWITGSGYGNSTASATSSWGDWFVISGGTGLGTASFTSVLDGKLASGKNGSAGYSLDIGYTTGAYCYYWYTACGEADQSQTLFSQSSSLLGKGKSVLSQDIEGEFTFEYDKAFRLTATLNAYASNGGTADFTLVSLGNSLSLPAGSSLLSASGLYAQAVPEAETYAMMLAGMGLVGFAAARRRQAARIG
jgi:hypothetical protein